MARKVSVEIVGDAASVQRAFKATSLGAKEAAGAIGTLRVSFAALAKSTVVIYAVEKAMEALTGAVHSGISEFKETTQIQAQTASVLKSTGEVANITAAQVHGLSLELSNLSGLSDEAIQASENVLLSFTNIRNFAGKNNDVFTQATKAVVDYAARTGKDASTAALIFGRALEDPAEKVAALSRAGIVFTKQQRDQIKAIQDTKGVLEAQKLLIRGLELRYEGAAAAAGKTLPGALEILKERFRDLAGEGIAKVAGPLRGAAVALSQFVVALTEAHGARAKLDVFVKGIDTLGRDIFDAVRKQVEGINFSAIAAVVGDKLASVDWRAEIERAAKALSRAVIVLLQRLREVISSVDWKNVGGYIAVGIEAAVAAVADFLAHVNWKEVVRQLALTLIATVKAAANIFLGVGETIGKQIIAGISSGLRAAGAALEKLAVEIVLKIIEPFTHLPSQLGGGPFQRMKTRFQQTLNDMNTAAAQAGPVIGSNLGQSLVGQVAAYMAKARKLVAPGATALGPPIPGAKKTAALPSPAALPLPLPPAPFAVAAAVSKAAGKSPGQTAAERLQKQQEARAKALAALVAKQFRQLGLAADGSDVVPQVSGLKRRLAQLTANVNASTLNTPKLQSELKRFRKVLSEGLVPRDVRSKIKDMMDGIAEELKGHVGSIDKFARTNQKALLQGLGLDGPQLKALKARLSQVGVNGLVPQGSASALAGTTVVHTAVHLDGDIVGRSVTKHQQRTKSRNPDQRRGFGPN